MATIEYTATVLHPLRSVSHSKPAYETETSHPNRGVRAGDVLQTVTKQPRYNPWRDFMPFVIADPTQTPTITAGLYATGDAVGGLLTFASVADDGSNSETGSILDTVVITDKTTQNAALELHLFNQTFTATADKAPFDPSDADLLNHIGVVTVSTYYNMADNSVGVARPNLPVKVRNSDGALYGQLVVRGGPTYASTSDLKVRLVVVKN